MKSKIKKSLGNLSKKVVTANEIKEKEYVVSPANGDCVNMIVNPIDTTVKLIAADWVKEIEAYCGEIGILPADLIETHRQSLKVAKKGFKEGKESKIKEAKEQISNWRSDYIKKKTGIGLLPEKIKDPYKNQ